MNMAPDRAVAGKIQISGCQVADFAEYVAMIVQLWCFRRGRQDNVSQINYSQNQLQNGLSKSLSLSTFYTPTTSSYVRGAISVGRQDAKIPAYAFGSRQFGMSYIRKFPGGIPASIAPTITILKYDAPLAAFSVTRHDRQYAVQLSLLDRRLDFHGLTPRIAYTFIRNDSNLSLYAFKRSRVEIGFTNSF